MSTKLKPVKRKVASPEMGDFMAMGLPEDPPGDTTIDEIAGLFCDLYQPTKDLKTKSEVQIAVGKLNYCIDIRLRDEKRKMLNGDITRTMKDGFSDFAPLDLLKHRRSCKGQTERDDVIRFWYLLNRPQTIKAYTEGIEAYNKEVDVPDKQGPE